MISSWRQGTQLSTSQKDAAIKLASQASLYGGGSEELGQWFRRLGERLLQAGRVQS